MLSYANIAINNNKNEHQRHIWSACLWYDFVIAVMINFKKKKIIYIIIIINHLKKLKHQNIHVVLPYAKRIQQQKNQQKKQEDYEKSNFLNGFFVKFRRITWKKEERKKTEHTIISSHPRNLDIKIFTSCCLMQKYHKETYKHRQTIGIE